MTRERVESIFGAGRGCVYASYAIGEIRYVNRQYRGSDGFMVAIQYNDARDGAMRTRRDPYGFKQWSTVKSC